jgi:hypothetical protein
MNLYFVAAAVLLAIVGAIHTVLGERLIFSRMRVAGVIPTNGGQLLRERNVRILWATWHLVTVMGWGTAAMLYWLGQPSTGSYPFLSVMVTVSMLTGSALVLVGTRGKHPGWVGLLGVAVLTALGQYA